MRVEGLERFTRALSAFPDAGQARIREALAENARRLVELARALAPIDEGTLRESVAVRPGRHPLAFVVTAGGPSTTDRTESGEVVDYALIREFTDHPFFWPAYRMLRKSFRARLSRAVNRAARESFST